jgi:hypothetical protein
MTEFQDKSKEELIIELQKLQNELQSVKELYKNALDNNKPIHGDTYYKTYRGQ